MTVVSKKKPAAVATTSRRTQQASTAAAMAKTLPEDLPHTKDDSSDTEDDDEDYIIALVQDPGAAAIMANGTTFALPKGSVVRADYKDRPPIRPGYVYDDGMEHGQEMILQYEARLIAPTNDRICLPGGVFGQVLDLPAGTLLRSESDLWRHKTLPPGGGHLQRRTELRDNVHTFKEEPFQLTHPVLLGHDLKIQKDITLTESVVLGGQMMALSDTKVPGKVVPLRGATVEVVSNGSIVKTYEIKDILFKGTVLLFGTIVPAGIALVDGTSIPSGTTLPVGTVLGNVCFQAGTVLPAGLLLPGGAWVPPQVFRHIKLVKDQHHRPNNLKAENAGDK